MPSIYDQVVAIGEQTAYATAVSTSKGIDARSDDWAVDTSPVTVQGFRRDAQATPTNQYRQVLKGATGSIETAFYTQGMGLLLKHLLGTSSGPTQKGSSGAYDHVFQTDDTGPTKALTIHVARVDVGGVSRPATYLGCIPTAFSISAAVDDGIILNVSYDGLKEDTGGSAASPTYVTAAVPFTWNDVVVKWNGSAVDGLTGFTLDGTLGMRTDRYYLKGSAEKAQPVRNARPEYTGTVEGDLESDTNTLYTAFKAGTTGTLSLEATYPAVIGTSTHKPKLVIEMKSIRFTGDTPTMSTDDTTKISLPYMVFHDGTNPAIKITNTTADSAF